MQSFHEVERLLARHAPSQAGLKRAYTLDTMRAIMDALGNPQNNYPVVHIAGTSGKTSTAYFMAGLLRGAGKKIGLTVSPHIDSINERVQINLAPLPEQDFCREFTTFMEIINKLSIKPSYFELLVAFAYWEFDRQQVDYAVIETGLGGLLDGTNVVSRPDKACILTDIGFDHAEILGNTLSKIAEQKVGIVQDHNAAITYQQSNDIMAIYKTYISAKHGQLIVVDDNLIDQSSKLPLFQQRNYWLAGQAFEYIMHRDGLSEISPSNREKIKQTSIPARMEVIPYQDKKVIVDGSHNEQKMHALVSSFQAKYPGTRVPVLLAVVSDKEAELNEILRELQPITRRIIVTAFDSAQDIQKRAIDPVVIQQQADAMGIDTEVLTNPKAAFKRLVSGSDPMVLVTGSFYLLNHVRPLIFTEQS